MKLYNSALIIEKINLIRGKVISPIIKFKTSFNWYKMTEQDFNVWKEIFRVLDNE